jgi:hypothetical protein
MPRPRTFDYDELLRLDGEGLTITEIAARLGHASKDSVYSALKRAKKNGVSGIVFPNDPDLVKPAPAPAPPRAPRPPAKCHANGCTDLAEGRLTHGTFAHPINLSEAARLDQGVPLCRRHYHAATGGYPCSKKRCTRVAYGVAASCSEHQPQPEPTPAPTKEPTMRNGTPGATPAERELSVIPSDISERVAEAADPPASLDQVLGAHGVHWPRAVEDPEDRSEFDEPAPVTPIGHVGGVRCFCEQCTLERLDRAIREPQSIIEQARDTRVRAWSWEPGAGAHIDVHRDGEEYRVRIVNELVDLDMIVPEWDAVERVLATFVRRAA